MSIDTAVALVKTMLDNAEDDVERASIHLIKGRLQMEAGKTPQAIETLTRAVRLDPENVDVYLSRAGAYWASGQFDKALADVNRAINIDPADDRHYFALTEVWRAMGKPKRAIVELKKLVDRDPKNVEALNGLAWTLATCPDAKVRDGKQAIKHARRACELTDWKFWGFLDTFAAASAAAGDFAAAVKWQVEAIRLAPDGRKIEKQEMRARLDLFKAKKPYRESPAKKTIPARSASE